ncbi:MAG: hypothetical protein ABSA01_12375 [Anaerolineales bacterium]|jgi:putative exporter of polyketide antibiotics
MKPARIPHPLIILSILLVSVTFLAGVLHAFDSARAASAEAAAFVSHPSGNETEFTPTPGPTSNSVPGDTTGIIVFAGVIVIIVLVGAIMGTNRSFRKKAS